MVYMLYHPARDWVLIETYWNVKSGVLSISRLPINGINRNILECKDGKKVVYRSNGLVLIETYWNVKACNLSRITAISRFYRNILECKVVAIPKNALTHIRINRNILECKGIICFPER